MLKKVLFYILKPSYFIINGCITKSTKEYHDSFDYL